MARFPGIRIDNDGTLEISRAGVFKKQVCKPAMIVGIKKTKEVYCDDTCAFFGEIETDPPGIPIQHASGFYLPLCRDKLYAGRDEFIDDRPNSPFNICMKCGLPFKIGQVICRPEGRKEHKNCEAVAGEY